MDLTPEALEIHAQKYKDLLSELPNAAAVELTMGISEAADELDIGDAEAALNAMETYFDRTVQRMQDIIEDAPKD